MGATSKIRAVIFDMDGVLIDAQDWHYEALNKALGLFGYAISRQDHQETYDGLPTARKLEMLTHEQGLPRGLHPFLSELKQQYTLQNVHNHCRPVFQREYALSRLKELGYRLAVCSNSIRHSVQMMLDKSGLSPFVEFYLSNQDVERAKPDPQMYRAAMDRLGLPPGECLIVEDNEHGIAAARASGAHVLVVGSTAEVNLENLLANIRRIESVA